METAGVIEATARVSVSLAGARARSEPGCGAPGVCVFRTRSVPEAASYLGRLLSWAHDGNRLNSPYIFGAVAGLFLTHLVIGKDRNLALELPQMTLVRRTAGYAILLALLVLLEQAIPRHSFTLSSRAHLRYAIPRPETNLDKDFSGLPVCRLALLGIRPRSFSPKRFRGTDTRKRSGSTCLKLISIKWTGRLGIQSPSYIIPVRNMSCFIWRWKSCGRVLRPPNRQAGSASPNTFSSKSEIGGKQLRSLARQR